MAEVDARLDKLLYQNGCQRNGLPGDSTPALYRLSGCPAFGSDSFVFVNSNREATLVVDKRVMLPVRWRGVNWAKRERSLPGALLLGRRAFGRGLALAVG